METVEPDSALSRKDPGAEAGDCSVVTAFPELSPCRALPPPRSEPQKTPVQVKEVRSHNGEAYVAGKGQHYHTAWRVDGNSRNLTVLAASRCHILSIPTTETTLAHFREQTAAGKGMHLAGETGPRSEPSMESLQRLILMLPGAGDPQTFFLYPVVCKEPE